MKRTRGMFGKRLLVVALTASMLTGTVDVTTLQAAAQTKQQEETENLTVNTPDEVSVRTIMDVPEQQEIDTEIEEPENEQLGKDEEQPEAGNADGKEESEGAENPDNPDEDAPEEIPDEEAGETEENPDKTPGEETDGKETTEGERAALSDEYGTQITTGDTGNCSYTIYDTDADGTGDLLVISGEGAMAGYEQWDKSRAWIDGNGIAVRKILIRYGVTRIGDNAFFNYVGDGSMFFNSLRTAEIETRDGRSTLEAIGSRAFYGSLVTQMNFPEGLKTIEEGAFWNAELGAAELPMSLETIDTNAFRASGITSIIIPPAVTYIGGSAFATIGGYPPKTVYNLCNKNLGASDPKNSAYRITLKVDDQEKATRPVLPGNVAAGTMYAGTVWDAASGFPYTEEETPYEWMVSESGERYSQTGRLAEITGDMTFSRYTYKVWKVSFHTEHVTKDGAESIRVNEGEEENYTCTLKPEDGYLLGKSGITVTVDGKLLGQEGYTYDGATGLLTIAGEHITGDLVISAKAELDISKCAASLTKDTEVTYYLTFEDAAKAAGEGEVTLTLLKDCTQKGDVALRGADITLDLNGRTLSLERLGLYVSGKGELVSSGTGGQIKGNIGLYMYNEKAALTLGRGVSVEGELGVERGAGAWIEGAEIESISAGGGSVYLSSGTVGSISWKEETPKITGGVVGALTNENVGGRRSEAFPDGYAVKNPDTGKLYTRAQIDAEDFAGKMQAVSCGKHVNEGGFCKYCNTKTDCSHSSVGTDGRCKKCGYQFCAMLMTGKEKSYYRSWKEVCDRGQALTAGDTAEIRLYQDLKVSTALAVTAGTVVVDLGGHSIEGLDSEFLKISGTADVTLRNGTAAGSNRKIPIAMSGGKLRIEQGTTLTWDENSTVYVPVLDISGGETVIDGAEILCGKTVMKKGSLTILDGDFRDALVQDGGTLELRGGTYIYTESGTERGDNFEGNTIKDSLVVRQENKKVGDLLGAGYAFRSTQDNSWIQDERLENTSISNVKVEKIPVAITQQPQSMEAYCGSTQILTVGTDTKKGVSYQWYRQGTEEDETLEGETEAVLEVPEGDAGMDAAYYCVVSCDGYVVKSDAATVSWRENLADCVYEPIAEQLYKGEPVTLQEKDIVVYPKGKDAASRLTCGTDFQIVENSYQNNNTASGNGAEASVTLKGIGNYGGELVVGYRIVNQSVSAAARLCRLGGAELKDLSLWTTGVLLYAPEGYLISKTADGSYDAYFEYAQSSKDKEGTLISYYLKDKTTGGVSAEKQVRVKIDADGPTFENGGIEIKGNWWRKLLSNVTLGAFFRESTVDVYITAEDAASGVAAYEYYIEELPDSLTEYRVKTDSELNKLRSEDKLTRIAVEENSRVHLTGLSEEKRYVIYAAAYDRVDNSSGYICTEGVVIDRTAPVIDPEKAWKTGGSCKESSIEYVIEVPEDCTLYYKAVRSEEELPEDDAEKAAVLFAKGDGIGSIDLKAGVTRFTADGLEPNRSYTLWYVARDRAGNQTEKALKKAIPDLTAKGEVKILGIRTADQVYNGAAYAYRGTPRIENTQGTDITDKLKLEYSYSGTLMDGGVYGPVKEAPSQAGSYILRVTADGEDYEGAAELGFVVEQAPVTIQAEDVQLTPGAELPADYGYKVSGLIGEDRLTKEPTVVCAATTTEEEAEYPITVSGAEAGNNYSITYQEGVLRIADERVYYTVSFDLMGHGSAIDAYTKVRAGSLIAEPEAPAETGYRFEGWYTDRECTQAWDFAQNDVNGDMTLYAGWLEQTETSGEDLENMYVREIPALVYTGSALKPVFTVYDGTVKLKAGRDYTVSYKNNVNASKKAEGDSTGGNGSGATPEEAEKTEGSTFQAELPYVKITGKGNYSGSLFVNFVIRPAELTQENSVLSCKDQNVVDKKKDQKPFGSLRYGKKGLKAGRDFTITLTRKGETQALQDKNGTPVIPKGESGTYVLTVTGAGNYCGTFTHDVEVKEDSSYLLKNAKLSLGKNQKKTDYVPGGVVLQPAEAVKEGRKTVYYPIVDKYGTRGTVPVDAKDCYTVSAGGRSLVYGQDYIAAYSGNDRAGKAVMTITGIGDYAGTKSVTFTITGVKASSANVTVKEGTLQEKAAYTGNPVTQNKVVLIYNKGKSDERELIYGTDYRITYRNNVKAGKAEMTFTMCPEAGFTGKVVKTFRIEKVDLNDEGVLKSEAITAKSLTAEYSKSGAKPDGQIVLTYQGRTLREGTDYTITYKDNRTVTDADQSGKGKMPTATLKGKGNFEGILSLNYSITPAGLKEQYQKGLVEIGIAGASYDAKKRPDGLYKPRVTVKEGKKALRSGTDYLIEYRNNDQASVADYLKKVEENGSRDAVALEETPRVVIEPKGCYNGDRIELPLPIGRTMLSAANLYVVVDAKQAVYTGKQVKPAVQVYYSADKALIKKAEKSRTVLSEKELTKADGDYRFTKLWEDMDYTLVYGANVTAGKNKGTVTVNGAGPLYGGSRKISFAIGSRNINGK